MNKLYGKESWDFKIIKTYNTAREALLAEQKYIKRCFKSVYSLNLRYFDYNDECLEDLNPVEKMLITRKILNKDGVTSYQTGGRKTAETKKTTILDDGRTLMQATVDKGAELRKNRGDYVKLAQEISDKGGFCSERKICEYCSADSTLGNYVRWHGDNCKMNPNITQEQLKKREPSNKGKKSQSPYIPNEKMKGIVSAFCLIECKNVRIKKEEFDKYKGIKYVGQTHKIAIDLKNKIKKENNAR